MHKSPFYGNRRLTNCHFTHEISRILHGCVDVIVRGVGVHQGGVLGDVSIGFATAPTRVCYVVPFRICPET